MLGRYKLRSNISSCKNNSYNDSCQPLRSARQVTKDFLFRKQVPTCFNGRGILYTNTNVNDAQSSCPAWLIELKVNVVDRIA